MKNMNNYFLVCGYTNFYSKVSHPFVYKKVFAAASSNNVYAALAQLRAYVKALDIASPW